MRSLKGMSFVDVIVGIALVLIIFTALTSLLITSLKVSVLAKTHSVAIAVAESQMEYIRSLSYANIGTVAGIPSGSIPQNATTTQNGVTLATRTFIEYVDDPADGLASGDTNGITTDYKRAKVSTTYYVGSTPHTVTIISNFSPPGIETTTGGGTLKIVVVNAAGSGVPGASVHILNIVASTSVDITTITDYTGTVFLPGAPVSSEYQVFVSKAGYSSSQTYTRNAANANPTPGYLTVAVNQTTTGTFAIDVLSNLVIRTFSPVATTTYTDSFTSSGGIGASANTESKGSGIILTGGVGNYAPSGTVTSIAISPTYLAGWNAASFITTAVPGTDVRFHIRDGNGALLPDTVLPGNATGYTGMISLSEVSPVTYPTLELSADLSTASASNTPILNSWTLTYRRGPIPLPNIAYTIAGTKSIGTDGANNPILKTIIATSTDSTGVSRNLLEWDSYGLTVGGYDVISACPAPSYNIAPATTLDSSLILSTSTGSSLLVATYGGGAPLSGATVTLSRTGFTQTGTTDTCGNAYFSSLTNASDYTLNATKTTYTTYSANNVSVSGHGFNTITLDPL